MKTSVAGPRPTVSYDIKTERFRSWRLCPLHFGVHLCPGTMSSEDKQWPVIIYRKTESGTTRMGDKRRPRKRVVINVSPRSGCILARKPRLRIKLDEENGTAPIMTRRKKKIFINLNNPSHQKVFIFQFSSVEACSSFSDRFVAFNPPLQRCESATTSERLNTEQANAQRRDVTSYVARLMHDNDFVSYVNRLEATLTGSEDGKKMLEALTARCDQP